MFGRPASSLLENFFQPNSRLKAGTETREHVEVVRREAKPRYNPALDGLRAIAICLVMLYHAGIPFVPGGFVGVDVFFVLSGYLIATLLFEELLGSGRINLRAFWTRRARRLLPALFSVVFVCGVYEAAAGPARAVPGFGGDAISTLLYVGNWHAIWSGNSYFQQTGLISPLEHTWSLAIEEQFYLLFPVLLVLIAKTRRRFRHTSWRSLTLWLAISGALASAIEMAVLYQSRSVSRVYFGTDTRSQGILLGVSLAAYLSGPGAAISLKRPLVTARLKQLGWLGAAGVVVIAHFANGNASWMYRGGFCIVEIATVCILASVTSTERGLLAGVLSWRPLVLIGRISYGLYLWHFPLFLWLNQASVGLGGWELLLLRLLSTLVVASFSYLIVERPFRRGQSRSSIFPAFAAAIVAVVASVAASWPATEGGDSGTVPSASVGLAGHGQYAQDLGKPGCPRTRGRCHVLHVMLVGDSIGLTLGMELGFNEARFGISVADEAILGCGFVTVGLSDENGSFTRPNPACRTADSQWKYDEARLHPRVLLVEMGYWDEVNWLQDGLHLALGNPRFDGEVYRQMRAFVSMLSSGGLQIVFLSVPWVDPAPWPNGQIPPQASRSRHQEINALLERLATSYPKRVHYFNIAPYVTPSGHYQTVVHGQQCRMADGVHFFVGGPKVSQLHQTKCAASLQMALFSYLRRLTGNSAGPP